MWSGGADAALVVAFLPQVDDRSHADAEDDAKEGKPDLDGGEAVAFRPEDQCEGAVEEEADAIEISVVPIAVLA